MIGSFRIRKVSCPLVKRRLGLVVGIAAASLTAPAAAEAASVGLLQPAKACYRSGELVGVGGSGYTPNTPITISSDGTPLSSGPTADANGNFAGQPPASGLRVGNNSGEKVKTYAFTDQSNPANTASLQLRVSAFGVSLSPRNGPPTRRFRIRASGFTTGRRLYAHVVRGRYRRTVGLGRLKGACHSLKTRRRIFASGLSVGIYTVQFDSRRRYSRSTKVKIRRRFQIFHRIR
jgi:hypothetical protein